MDKDNLRHYNPDYCKYLEHLNLTTRYMMYTDRSEQEMSDLMWRNYLNRVQVEPKK